MAAPPPRARLTTRPPPELLAPAGDWDCARAAVENGADAIYFGLERCNARLRANNFTEAELPALMEYLHRRGVKGYLCFNTLVFPDEFAAAEATLRSAIGAGVDAAIVQDVGIARLIRQLSPDFPIHASTQMSITSAAGVAFARELGCDLVVLARECSLKEIEAIQAAPRAGGSDGASGPPAMPLEVFVHGALCVAYSGQCLTSEALGGRSANRGECAQACRLPYELLADGHPVPLGDRRYLLSPRDLAGLNLLPDLVRAGLSSLKIEGRLKTPAYVASITRLYRQGLDALACGAAADEIGTTPGPPGRSSGSALETPQAQYEMEMAFSRGLHSGWLRGVNNQELVHARFGKKRGVYLGQVVRVRAEAVVVRLEGPLKPGDGVVFDAGRPDQPEEGGRVYGIEPVGERRGAAGRSAPSPGGDARGGRSANPGSRPVAREVVLGFGRGDVDYRRIGPGDRLWKTSDPELERRVRLTYTGDQPRFTRPLHLQVRGRVGEALILTAQDELGHAVEVRSGQPLVPATHQPLEAARLRAQLGRLGGTGFHLGSLRNDLTGEVILPLSELNRLRRELVEQLVARRTQGPRWGRHNSAPTPHAGDRAESGAAPSLPRLRPLVRSLPQLEAALQAGAGTVYCDFDDPKKYREAVSRCRAWPGPAPIEVFVAPPRITKPREGWILEQVRSCVPDGYLVRTYDQLDYFARARCVGDYSLNVANHLSAEYFKGRYGLERLTASYDLNNLQVEALLRAAPPAWFEITLHQHIPMFHMEHCVFCAFLSQGNDFTNCGRPCDRIEVRLRDRVGAEHPVKADAGCRNTVFNALAQTGAEHVERFLGLGARDFRVEFVNETPAQVTQTLDMYARLLRQEITGSQLWRTLKLRHQLGVTRGTLE